MDIQARINCLWKEREYSSLTTPSYPSPPLLFPFLHSKGMNLNKFYTLSLGISRGVWESRMLVSIQHTTPQNSIFPIPLMRAFL
jgi:hypothetical protein